MERIKMTLADRKVHAKTLREYAKKDLADSLEHWKDDREMQACARADAKDIREAARLLLNVGAAEALAHIQSLDTFVRDGIPNDVWDALQSNDDYKRYTEQDERDILCCRIRNLTHEKEAIEAKLKAANQQLMRLDACAH